jgi:hypothetical protein
MSHNFRYRLPPGALPPELAEEQAQPEVKGKAPSGLSLREVIARKLETWQKTKARRDYLIDQVIRELRLN